MHNQTMTTELHRLALPKALAEYARHSNFPNETMAVISRATLTADSLPFFEWLVSVLPPSDPSNLEKLQSRLHEAEMERKRIGEKLDSMERKIKNLMEKPVHESLSEEIDDLNNCLRRISGADYNEKKATTRAAVQQLLRQEAVLTSHICEMEEDGEDYNSEEIVAATAEVNDRLSAFEQVHQLQSSVERVALSAEIEAAKAETLAQFADTLRDKIGNVNNFTQDSISELSILGNDLNRVTKKMLALEAESLKYTVLREKIKLSLSSGRGIFKSISLKQKQAADAMLLQESRYRVAIDIMKLELKNTMKTTLRFAQCLEFIDRSLQAV